MLLYQIGSSDLDIPVLRQCLTFLSSHDMSKMCGVHEVGNGIHCIISNHNTMSERDAIWEAHKKYVDVHCLISGQERIRVAPTEKAQVGTYSDSEDYLEVVATAQCDIVMEPGTVLCLFPNDAHQVKVNVFPDKCNAVKKAIFKIPLECFINT